MNKQLNLMDLKECSLAKPCPNCGNDKGHIYPSSGIHCGFIRCSECDRFLKWISKREFDRASAMGIIN